VKKILGIFLALVLVLSLSLVTAVPVGAAELLPATVDAEGRPPLEGTITADGDFVSFDIRAIGQGDDGDDINPSKYYSQTNFDNEYFTISAAGKFVKYNMWNGNTTPYWGTSWGDATNPLPDGVTFSQVEDGDDFVYAVSMSYAILGISDGDTFAVQIKARDFNDDYVQSYSGYDGYDGEYSQYRGLWITDTGVFEVTLPKPVIEVNIDIKPGSDPNSINLSSNGVVPVAILGSADFDVTTVDPLSVELAGASVRIKGKSGNAGSYKDVNGDGYLDLVVQVYTTELVLGDGIADLTGLTYDGVPIHGTDSIRIVPPE